MEFRIGEVERLLGRPYWRIHYAHRSRRVPEPRRFNNQRVYTEADLARLAAYFGVPAPQVRAEDAPPPAGG